MIAATQPLNGRETKFKRDYISWSAISTYQQCPLRFYFRYIKGLDEHFLSASFAFGGAVHSAAEFHFNELMARNPSPDHDTLLGVFWQEWKTRSESAEIRFGKKEDLDSIAKTADRVIEAFRESDIAQPKGRIIGVEEELRSELVPGLPEVLGRVDLIVESEDALTITDLKTARTRWSTDQAERSGEQLLLYAGLAKDLAPGKPIKLEFSVVTKGTKPTVESLPVSFDQRRLDRTQLVMRRVWDSIQDSHFFPSPSPMNCPGCAFRGPCEAWQG